MQRGNILDVLRRGRASWSAAILYLLLLPIALGVLPKPEATAEFLLLRDLASSEICSMPGSSSNPGQPVQHQPDCILCSSACPSAAAPPPVEAAEPNFLHFAQVLPRPKIFALPASRRFISDIQSRGPPATT
jgi:hypothetical protein